MSPITLQQEAGTTRGLPARQDVDPWFREADAAMWTTPDSDFRAAMDAIDQQVLRDPSGDLELARQCSIAEKRWGAMMQHEGGQT